MVCPVVYGSHCEGISADPSRGYYVGQFRDPITDHQKQAIPLFGPCERTKQVYRKTLRRFRRWKQLHGIGVPSQALPIPGASQTVLNCGVYVFRYMWPVVQPSQAFVHTGLTRVSRHLRRMALPKKVQLQRL